MAKAVISNWDANYGWWRVLAPYLAVAVGWLWLENAWLAIGGYHVLIVVLLWMSHRASKGSVPGTLFSGGTTAQVLGLVGILAGVSAVFVAFSDFIVEPSILIPTWLAERGLGGNHVLFAAYYGLVHPFLEEAHYRPLRQAEGEPAWRRRALEVGFAGYHVLVVYGFLRIPFVVSTFVGLWGVMTLWRWMDARTGGGRLPLAFHIVADLAVSSCVLRWMS